MHVGLGGVWVTSEQWAAVSAGHDCGGISFLLLSPSRRVHSLWGGAQAFESDAGDDGNFNCNIV